MANPDVTYIIDFTATCEKLPDDLELLPISSCTSHRCKYRVWTMQDDWARL